MIAYGLRELSFRTTTTSPVGFELLDEMSDGIIPVVEQSLHVVSDFLEHLRTIFYAREYAF